MTSPAGRLAELRGNLATVRSRIDRGCAAAGRSGAEVTLVAVTKFFPVSDAALLAGLGVTELGESRDQEASAKAAELPQLTDVAVHWHFVGRLQSNKARSVARYADLVHSVDSEHLAAALAEGVRRAQRPGLDVLVQLSLDAEAGSGGRGGRAGDELLRLADRVAETGVLRLAGVMAIAAQDGDPEQAFVSLAELGERLRNDHPDAGIVSAGMSNDLEVALRHGATHVRIGTALLGQRQPNIR